MGKNLVQIFTNCYSIINWFYEPGFLGMKRAANVIIVIWLSVAIVLQFSDENLILNRIYSGILTATVLFILFLTSLKFFLIKPPKYMRKGAESPEELFKMFCHSSYIYGAFAYSLLCSILITSFLKISLEFVFGIENSLNLITYNLFLIISMIFTVIYFMYHLVITKISSNILKLRLRLYLAIITTITAGLAGNSTKEILLPLITYLGIGFAWLFYLIDKVEIESNS